ncbi:Yippee zinc-binding protein [Aphelenchoides avenae]|nr:Yippee zinc-binding protein [Aphelenchus avenae]
MSAVTMEPMDDFQMVSCKSENKALACTECNTFLTYCTNIVSRTFRGTTGPAALCQDVVNTSLGEAIEKDLITGRHIVRDVFCGKCKTRLGWVYDKAFEVEQKYKEGKTVLEMKLVQERNLTERDLPEEEDEWVVVPMPAGGN